MTFQKGHKLSPGRTAGSLNKRSVAFFQSVEEEGFDAAKAMIGVYRDARKIYESYGLIYAALEEARIEKGEDSFPTEDKADKYLKIALDAAKDIAAYCYPKPKFPDQKTPQYLENMTPEQKIKALEHAASVLKAQVSKDESGT